MQCEICHKAPAVVHYTEIVNNKVTKLHLCERCAAEKGLFVKPGNPGDMVAKMIDDTSASEDEKVGTVKCPQCGLLYSTFKETGRFGCSACYDAFSHQLKPLLRRVHGSTEHVGKTPIRDGEVHLKRREIQKLREKLEEAISKEEFEKAAQIRDKIKALEAEE